MQSKASTVAQYLADLPADRRAAISALRSVILKNLDKNYEEVMSYGMISYVVPHRVYPAGYHCNPKEAVPFACLASQKSHMSLHLMPLYTGTPLEKWFTAAWKKTGKKLDMGKACIRFKKIEDVPLDVVAEAIRRVPANTYIGYYEEGMKALKKAPASARKPAPQKKAATKKAVPAKAKAARAGR